MSVTENDQRAEYIRGLRAVADLLEATPDLPLPDLPVKFDWNVWPHNVANVAAEMARIARLLRTKLDKNAPDDDYSSKYYTLTGSVGGMPVEIASYRDAVCTRVVTGTVEITKTVPAPDARMVEVTETVETVEWICEPLLAKATA